MTITWVRFVSSEINASENNSYSLTMCATCTKFTAMFVPQKTTTNTKENHGNSKMCATICGLKMRSCAFDRFKIVAFLFNFPQFLVIQNEKSTLEKQKKKSWMKSNLIQAWLKIFYILCTLETSIAHFAWWL